MNHLFSIMVDFGSADLADSFQKELMKQQKNAKHFSLFHRNTCVTCEGTGEVGAKGKYLGCPDCEGTY